MYNEELNNSTLCTSLTSMAVGGGAVDRDPDATTPPPPLTVLTVAAVEAAAAAAVDEETATESPPPEPHPEDSAPPGLDPEELMAAVNSLPTPPNCTPCPGSEKRRLNIN